MKIVVAGATGAIGRELLPRLITAGHHVTALTRSESKLPALRQAGADPAVCDVYDVAHLRQIMTGAAPDVVIHELTDLPKLINMRKLAEYYEMNNRVRREGTRNLVNAARAAGARRFIVQSMASWYAPGNAELRTETDPLFVDAPEPVGGAVRALKDMEEVILGSGMEAVVLRYGGFYGPGTWHGVNGMIWKSTKKRLYPLIGEGKGVYSWIWTGDAASATVAALEGAPGIYNVCDDEPVEGREWLPYYAKVLGAKPPLHVPFWLARMIGGGLVAWERTIPGASNAKIKREWGWQPRYSSWRQGFVETIAKLS